MRILKCEYCRKEFYTNNRIVKYCGAACRSKAGDERKREREQAQNNQIKNLSLDETNRRARAAGMSYGKFVAMQYAERLKNERTMQRL